ncbi:hypothetical protein SAMN05444521_5278 [Streptomyces sp. 3214.6]|nr:hypothetical protein SAMN05444521_5278 [Streptomyces sp. 3214.6]
MRQGPPVPPVRRGRPAGARPAWSAHDERHPARPPRSHERREPCRGRPEHREHPGPAAHRGCPERPAHPAYPGHQEHPEGQAAGAAEARPAPRAAPSDRGRRASSRRGGRHRGAYRQADSARRPARSAHREAAARCPRPLLHPLHQVPPVLPVLPVPPVRRGPGPTPAAWARTRPPGCRARPARTGEPQACCPAAHPAFPAHPEEAAAPLLSHGYDAEAAPPCWSRRRRCHRRSARAAAQAQPDRPEPTEHRRAADSRTTAHAATHPVTEAVTAAHPAHPGSPARQARPAR